VNDDQLLEELRANGISSSQISDANVYMLIRRLLRLYNRYRPQLLHSTITTVAYQGEYDIDADANSIVEVFWEPSATSDVLARVLTEIKAMETDFHYPSLLKIHYAKLASLADTVNGNWRMYGRQIRLIPVPTESGTVVPYLYTKGWDDLDDIPIDDEELLIEGIEVLARRSLERSNSGSVGWRAGDYSVDGNAGARGIDSANREYSMFLSRLAGGAVGGRS